MSKVIPVIRPTRVALPLAALGLVLAAASAPAAPVRTEVDGNLVHVQVQVDGWPAPLYVRGGSWDRTYFQAFKGKNYSLVISNQTGERVGVLIAVDGLNVVNGQRSALAAGEAMYVLSPYESATIRGWRTSLNDVRRFVFVDEERSYASRTDQASGDMGWIRVLSFREKAPLVWREPQPRLRDQRQEWRGDGARAEREELGKEAPPPASAAPEVQRGDLRAQKSGEMNRMAPQSDAAPGTGWGDQRYDPVGRTEFTAVRRPVDHLVLRYEYASGLRALGIDLRERRVWQRERGELGFAQPPRW